MTIPIPALEAFKRHLEAKMGLVDKLDAQMASAPNMPPPLIDAIMDVRNALARKVEPDSREWFWRIIDAEGPQGLPSDEETALRMLFETWRRGVK